ncbi:MAG: hypothetical protein AAGC55_25785, partial [Myxococcota bacterium]
VGPGPNEDRPEQASLLDRAVGLVSSAWAGLRGSSRPERSDPTQLPGESQAAAALPPAPSDPAAAQPAAADSTRHPATEPADPRRQLSDDSDPSPTPNGNVT